MWPSCCFVFPAASLTNAKYPINHELLFSGKPAKRAIRCIYNMLAILCHGLARRETTPNALYKTWARPWTCPPRQPLSMKRTRSYSLFVCSVVCMVVHRVRFIHRVRFNLDTLKYSTESRHRDATDQTKPSYPSCPCNLRTNRTY